MVSWIHEDDFVRAVQWLLDCTHLDGIVNVTAPNALANAEFMRDLRRAWGAPIGLPSSSLVLALGAWMLRTEPELVLKSRWSYPRRLLESGFTFRWARWPEAAADLCRRWRVAKSMPAATGGSRWLEESPRP